MKNIFNWPMWHWHFELTSACTLKCPRCSRTELPEELVIQHLDLNFFKTNFPATVFSEVRRISLCGYDGDPIYNKEFIEICQYFKTCKPEVELYIVTNGSYKKPSWWKELGSILNEYDQIHFSLDGFDQESNQKYRVNSNWNTIIEGIQSLNGTDARLIWDMIYFDFNYQHVSYMIELAKQLGFDAMRQTKSNKFNFFYDNYEKDLEPPREYISSSGRFESETIYFTGRTISNVGFDQALVNYRKQELIEDIMPLCMIGTKGLYVDSQGYFYPCCWIVNKYNSEAYRKWLTPDKNIKLSGLESVLNNPFWETFIKNIPTTDMCKLKCHTSEVDEETVQRW